MSNTSDTVANKIWNEIKKIDLNLFGLADQTVDKYFDVLSVEPTKCYLTIKVAAALPALETIISKKYSVEQAAKFIVISYK